MSLGCEGASVPLVATMNGGTNGNSGSNAGWGGDWSAWIILFILFFAFGGWGNRSGYGQGSGSGSGGGVMDGYILTSDFANIERKLDGVNNGLCEGFYNVNAGMLNGFGAVQMQLANGFGTLDTSLCQVTNNIAQGQNATNLAILQAQNAIQSQAAECCCQNRYDALQNSNAIQTAVNTGFCQTNYNAQSNTRDIIEAQNASTRLILEKLTQQEIAAKDAQIAAQNQQIFGLQLRASQEAQNTFLVDKLGYQCPKPAYVVQPPQNVTFPTNCCGNVAYANMGAC